MNKILSAVVKAKGLITAKGLTPEQVEKQSRSLDMDLQEYCLFQNLKSIASVSGILGLDEAQTVYAYLGNTVEHFNQQPLEVKWVLSELLSLLLDKKIKGKL